MTRYAIVSDGVVVNVILWDGQGSLDSEGQLIEAPEQVGPGWLLAESEWIAPSLAPDAEPEAPVDDNAATRVAALEKLIALGLTEEEALAIAGA